MLKVSNMMLHYQHYMYLQHYTYHSQEQGQLFNVQQITKLYLSSLEGTQLDLLNILTGTHPAQMCYTPWQQTPPSTTHYENWT